MTRYSANPWRDVGAGLCVAGLLLPEAVAYAGIAHLPVVHAFMAAAVGLLVYALWGGSRFAVVAPTSSTAALVAAAAGTVASASGGGAAYTQVVVAMVLVSGAMLLALAWLKQGQLSSFISRPVLKAFAFALAITIVIKQLPDALGLALPPGVSHDTLQLLYYVLTHVADWHGLSLAIAVASIALVMALRRVPRWPASLLVVVGGVVLAYGADLQSHGVQAVGQIAPMALQLQVPVLSNAEWLRCAELAFGLVMLILRSPGAVCAAWRWPMAIPWMPTASCGCWALATWALRCCKVCRWARAFPPLRPMPRPGRCPASTDCP